jgi:hypothetical protein
VADEAALALKLIEPQIRNFLAGKDEYGESKAIELLQRIDPTRALEVLEEAKVADREKLAYLKARTARRLLRDSPDEALAIIEAAGDPWLRADGYRRASDVLPDAERAKKRERLSQALIQVRGIKDPEYRLIFLGQIAGRLLAVGETRRASELFREGEAMARELPVAAAGGYARGAFAEELVEFDRPAALALIKDLSEEGSFDRHHGNIAQRLAARDPAEAERIWETLKGWPMRDGIGQRVCYRMAPTDRERAQRIAGKLTIPYTRAYALGMMALALSEKDKEAAVSLLDEALASLVARAGSEKENYANSQSAAATTALLLPVAERIDPGRVSETHWRALALRGPRCDDEHEEVGRLGSEAVTAMMVARYDRSVAQVLLGPILDRLARLIAGGVSYLPDPLFEAPAVIDPRRAVALVESLPAATDPSHGDRGRRRLIVAEMLALHGADRWRTVVQGAGFWDVDGYDLVDDD